MYVGGGGREEVRGKGQGGKKSLQTQLTWNHCVLFYFKKGGMQSLAPVE